MITMAYRQHCLSALFTRLVVWVEPTTRISTLHKTCRLGGTHHTHHIEDVSTIVRVQSVINAFPSHPPLTE
jgi:hypothetical protein